jgi:hypothetical protein
MRNACGLGHERIDRHQQVERAERIRDQPLVGHADKRIGAYVEQCAHLALARCENLLRERRGELLAAEQAGTANAARRYLRIEAWRRDHLRMERTVWADHVGQRSVTRALHPPADEVEAVDEMLGGVAEGRHAGPGAGIGAALACIAREHLRDGEQLARLELGPALDQRFVERLDRGAQLRQALGADMACAEIAILPAVGEDDADDPRHHRDVLAGHRLQHEIGIARRLGAARIDRDDLLAGRLGALDPADRIGGHDRQAMRDQRIYPEDQDHLGLVEVMGAAAPSPHPLERDELRRLVDRQRGVELGRADRPHERGLDAHPRRVERGAAAGVHRKGL